MGTAAIAPLPAFAIFTLYGAFVQGTLSHVPPLHIFPALLGALLWFYVPAFPVALLACSIVLLPAFSVMPGYLTRSVINRVTFGALAGLVLVSIAAAWRLLDLKRMGIISRISVVSELLGPGYENLVILVALVLSGIAATEFWHFLSKENDRAGVA